MREVWLDFDGFVQVICTSLNGNSYGTKYYLNKNMCLCTKTSKPTISFKTGDRLKHPI